MAAGKPPRAKIARPIRLRSGRWSRPEI